MTTETRQPTGINRLAHEVHIGLAELCDRAERAEAAVERVRAKAEGWAALFDNALTPEGQTLRDAARDILRALDGER